MRRPASAGPLVLLAALALAVLPACSDDDGGTGPGAVGTVVLELDHVVSDPGAPAVRAPLAFDTMAYANAAGDPYSVTKLVYIVSEFALHVPDSLLARHGDVERDVPHYRDGRDDATRTITLEDVPVGTYERLEFTFGLDDERNCFVTDAACPGAGYVPDEAAFNSMEWPIPLGGGYHYMKLEGNYENDSGATVGYTTHTGHNRNPTTMEIDDHSIRIELDLDDHARLGRHGGIEVTEGGTVTIRLEMDLNQWYQDPNPYEFDDHGAIMMDWATQVQLRENGADAWSVAEIR